MTYSFTQISQYLQCPRKYRYRYLDGWREKEDRASMIFGRCFENALAAYFREEDSTAVFFKEWQEHQDTALQYAKNDSWDRLYHQGIRLLERFAQDDRVQIGSPKRNLQVKCKRSLARGANPYLSWMRLASWTERNASSIGKRQCRVIRSSPRVCCPSTRSSFATRG